MARRFYEDPSGHFRNVAVHIEPAAEKRFAEADGESIEKHLDAAVEQGAITTDDRFDWRNRLRAERELASEILESLPGDREYADRAALRVYSPPHGGRQWLSPHTDCSRGD